MRTPPESPIQTPPESPTQERPVLSVFISPRSSYALPAHPTREAGKITHEHLANIARLLLNMETPQALLRRNSKASDFKTVRAASPSLSQSTM